MPTWRPLRQDEVEQREQQRRERIDNIIENIINEAPEIIENNINPPIIPNINIPEEYVVMDAEENRVFRYRTMWRGRQPDREPAPEIQNENHQENLDNVEVEVENVENNNGYRIAFEPLNISTQTLNTQFFTSSSSTTKYRFNNEITIKDENPPKENKYKKIGSGLRIRQYGCDNCEKNDMSETYFRLYLWFIPPKYKNRRKVFCYRRLCQICLQKRSIIEPNLARVTCCKCYEKTELVGNVTGFINTFKALNNGISLDTSIFYTCQRCFNYRTKAYSITAANYISNFF